jgi:transposase-like protein
LRRLWEGGEKIGIVAQTRVPGISVSQVAPRYDVNANLIFKWLREPRFNGQVADQAAVSFLPVEVFAEPPALDRACPINCVSGHVITSDEGVSKHGYQARDYRRTFIRL